MIFHDLIIVGGGAAGLTAAIKAKDLGLDVCILEATDRIGKKILTTGNGRCNISNNCICEPFSNYHSNNSMFFENALKSFSTKDTEEFFLFLGLPWTELKDGKLYPQSLQASSVVDIFKMAIEDRDIPIYYETKVKTIDKKKQFIINTSNDDFKCNNLLICTGGKSAPKTGSDGSGYTLVKNFGHKITPLLPGIVQLKLNYNSLKAISGVKFDGYATLISNNKEIRKDFGEILFTDYGISGPPILQLSSHASIALNKKENVKIVVDMMPNHTKDDLHNFLEGHFAIFNHRPVINSLVGIIHKKLIPILLRESGITNLHMPCYELEWQQKRKLLDLLKNWEFDCTDTNGFNSAQVTVGGVDTKDVNSSSLESKLVPNLFFAGEVLDVHGDCGGFNLQWAWSSAMKVIEYIASKK